MRVPIHASNGDPCTSYSRSILIGLLLLLLEEIDIERSEGILKAEQFVLQLNQCGRAVA
jgi:hypothetical protein